MTHELLIPALRQYSHNNGDAGLVTAYDKSEVDRVVATLNRKLEETTTFAEELIEKNKGLNINIGLLNIALEDKKRLLGICEEALVERDCKQTKVLDEIMNTSAEAYQVIGVLADCAQLYDHSSIANALDYFGDIANGEKGKRLNGEILPFSL